MNIKQILVSYSLFVLATILISSGLILNNSLGGTLSADVNDTSELSTETNDILINSSKIKADSSNLYTKQVRSISSDIIVGRKTCSGQWIKFADKKINIGEELISEWKAESKPALLSETKNNPNKVVIGHNNCENGDCNKPTTDFAQIINLEKEDKVEACIDNALYEGVVTFSKPLDNSAVEILGTWKDYDSLTFFTCYGKCTDISCSNTEQRWVIAVDVSL